MVSVFSFIDTFNNYISYSKCLLRLSCLSFVKIIYSYFYLFFCNAKFILKYYFFISSLLSWIFVFISAVYSIYRVIFHETYYFRVDICSEYYRNFFFVLLNSLFMLSFCLFIVLIFLLISLIYSLICIFSSFRFSCFSYSLINYPS